MNNKNISFFSVLTFYVALITFALVIACNSDNPENEKKTKIDTLAQKAKMLCTPDSLDAKVDTISINSAAMNKKIKAVVIRPACYDLTQCLFKTIYILHGYSDSYKKYLNEIPHLKQLANQHRVLIVCPDGGYNSWYINSPVDSSVQYETHISQEVVEAMDKKYRTEKSKSGRAITGHSMGGHGALLMAIKHPDVFGAAGSMSGGVDLTYKTTSWDLQQKLGDYKQNRQNWHDNSVIHNIEKLQGIAMPLIIDCGTDDFFYEINRNLHQKMLQLKIPHDYTERPGKHNWDYWRNAIDYQMLFFSKFFNQKS